MAEVMNERFLRSPQSIGIEISEMRREAKLTDLSFVCRKNDTSFHSIDAHQVIFSSISEELKMLIDIAKHKQPYEKVVIIIDSVNSAVMEKLVQYIYTGEVIADDTEKQKLIQLCALLKLNISLKLDTVSAIEFDTPLLDLCNQMSCSHWIQTSRKLAHVEKGAQSALNYASFSNKVKQITSTRGISPDVTLDETEISSQMSCSYRTQQLKEIFNQDIHSHWKQTSQLVPNHPSCYNEVKGITNTRRFLPDVALDETKISKQNSKIAVSAIKIHTKKENINDQSSLTNIRKRRLVNRFQVHHINDITNLPTSIPRISKLFPRNLSCKYCESTISTNRNYFLYTPQNLNLHIMQVHDKIRMFHCEKCSYSAATKQNLQIHNHGVHDNIKKFHCDKCRYSSVFERNLKMHIKAVHRKRKPYSCDKCGFRMAKKNELKMHFLKCLKVK